MTIKHGDFSFELGEQENTFLNITYHNPLGGEAQVLNVAAMSQLLESNALSVSDLSALDFPCKEAARSINAWLASQKNKFDQECFNAKTRGDPLPTWWPLWG